MENSVADNISLDPFSNFTEEMRQSLSLATRTTALKQTPRELFAIAPMVDVSDRFFRYFMR